MIIVILKSKQKILNRLYMYFRHFIKSNFFENLKNNPLYALDDEIMLFETFNAKINSMSRNTKRNKNMFQLSNAVVVKL